jgi:hypothetical protein
MLPALIGFAGIGPDSNFASLVSAVPRERCKSVAAQDRSGRDALGS